MASELIFPEKMEPLGDDLKKNQKILEDYIRYITERVDFAFTNYTTKANFKDASEKIAVDTLDAKKIRADQVTVGDTSETVQDEFDGLETGNTTINGNCITTGTLNANLINAGTLKDTNGNFVLNLGTGEVTLKKAKLNIETSTESYDAIKLQYNISSKSADVMTLEPEQISFDAKYNGQTTAYCHINWGEIIIGNESGDYSVHITEDGLYVMDGTTVVHKITVNGIS